MTFEEFLASWGATRFPTEWRQGQSLFNHLHDLRPDLAHDLRGLAIDPFYVDARVPFALDWIETYWED